MLFLKQSAVYVLRQVRVILICSKFNLANKKRLSPSNYCLQNITVPTAAAILVVSPAASAIYYNN